MKIAIIDADLIGRDKHRFPNLACEKLSGYHKEQGDDVTLVMNYDWLPLYMNCAPEDKQMSLFDAPEAETEDALPYDRIYISRVFTNTPVPKEIDELKYRTQTDEDIIQIGGTGFYFDKAPNLPDAVEHHMPDYHLYDAWIAGEVADAEKAAEQIGKTFNKTAFMVQFKEYTDYSIGFTTRGCFRKCPFCVNQKYDHVFLHSPLEEFYDPERPKICLLDDNVLGCAHWKDIITELQVTRKSFKFKQGMDERLLTEERCKVLFSSRYDGDYTFAFDNIFDYDLIHEKLKLISKYNTANKSVKFYVLVGFESTDAKDIENAFRRVELLLNYRCLPYIMRYMNKNDTPWKRSKYRSLYVTMARWCNQPNFVKKKTFREFCEANQAVHKTEGTYCSAMKCLLDFEEEHPEIAGRYFDIRFGEENPNIAD